MNFLKRYNLVNYERIGKSPRINDVHTPTQIVYVKLKYRTKIYLTLKERERREREKPFMIKLY